MVKPVGGMGLEKDIDYHNQRLWKRKKYKEQKRKDQVKKVYSDFRKLQGQDGAGQEVDDK